MVFREKMKDGTTRITGGIMASPDGGGVVFSFPVAALVWTCVHNLDQIPVDVTTVDTAGDIVFGDVDHVNSNTVTITWYSPLAGAATIQS